MRSSPCRALNKKSFFVRTMPTANPTQKLSRGSHSLVSYSPHWRSVRRSSSFPSSEGTREERTTRPKDYPKSNRDRLRFAHTSRQPEHWSDIRTRRRDRERTDLPWPNRKWHLIWVTLGPLVLVELFPNNREVSWNKIWCFGSGSAHAFRWTRCL